MYNVDWAAIRGGGRSLATAASITPRLVQPAAHRSRRVHPIVWALGFTSLFTDIASEMVSSILPMYLVLHLRISPAAYGVIDGVYQGGAVLVRLAAGLIGDRWRCHKAVAGIGYLISAVSRLALLVAGNAWMAIAGAVAADRVGKGIRTAPRDAMITLNTPPGDLGMAFGVHRALDACGAMIGPLAAFLVLALVPDGFDLVFVISLCVALIGVAILVLFVDDRQAPAAGKAVTRQSAHAIAGLLRAPGFRSIAIASAALSVATVSDAFLFLALQEQLEFSPGLFPLLFVAISLVSFACSAPFGRWADRFGRARTFVAGHALLLGAYAAVLVPGGMVRLAAALVLLGAYYAATDGVLAALTSSALPLELAGTGLAVTGTIVNTGRLVGALLFGALWTWSSVQSAAGVFTAALMLSIGMAVLALGRSTPPRGPVPVG